MDYISLAKNNKQYLKLVSLYKKDKLGSVCLLVSGDSLLTEAICYALAATITNSSAMQIAKKSHPDVFVYGDSGKIDVSNISEIVESLSVRPYSADKKIYILLDSQNMNDASQNKLLKSLEDAPRDVIFLLTAVSTKNILSTVLSRATEYKIDGLENCQIYDLLLQNGASKEVAEIAVSCAGGNSTLARKLTTESFAELYVSVLEMLEKVDGSKDCLQYVHKFDSKNVDKEEIVDICALLVRDVAMIISGAPDLIVNKHHQSELKEIAEKLNLKACSKILETCSQLKQDLFFNASGVTIVDRLVLTIAEEKAKCRK